MKSFKPLIHRTLFTILVAFACLPAFAEEEPIGIVMSSRDGVIVTRQGAAPAKALAGTLLYRDSVLALAQGVKVGIVQVYTALDGLTTFTRFPVYLSESKSQALTRDQTNRILAEIGGSPLMSSPSPAPPPKAESGPRPGSGSGRMKPVRIEAAVAAGGDPAVGVAVECAIPFGGISFGVGADLLFRPFADGESPFSFEGPLLGAAVHVYPFRADGAGPRASLHFAGMLPSDASYLKFDALLGWRAVLRGGFTAGIGLGCEYRFAGTGDAADGDGLHVAFDLSAGVAF
ncbi:MAG: hypothetical protein NT080_04300 [Spirochaetes bacterium]|nr:hypothetical protein [Spirochaetota bacterium]